MSDRSHEVIYRPALPKKNLDFGYPDWRSNSGLFYYVNQGNRVIFAYLACYFKVGEVLTDVIARSKGIIGLAPGLGTDSKDFAIWYQDRLIAIAQFPVMDPAGEGRFIRFDDESFLPKKGYVALPLMDWPSRERWLADGGDLIIPSRDYIEQNDRDTLNLAQERFEDSKVQTDFEPLKPYVPGEDDEDDEDDEDG